MRHRGQEQGRHRPGSEAECCQCFIVAVSDLE